MSVTRCSLCGNKIVATDVVVRVVAEVISRGPGDPTDYERWSHVHDWTDLFSAHVACAHEERELRHGQIEIPAQESVFELISEGPERFDGPELSVVR
jgi:hypothetical protein